MKGRNNTLYFSFSLCRLFFYFLYRFHSLYRPLQCFFSDILHAEYRAATDVYALMFLTDVIDFIIIVFGFWAFGVKDGSLDGREPLLSSCYLLALFLFGLCTL